MSGQTFSLFSDTGGILVLDPDMAEILTQPEVLQCLNAVLDPDGRTCATSGHTDWRAAWSAAAASLRQATPDGGLQVLLTGEGTFWLTVSSSTGELARPRRPVPRNTFTSVVRVRSGQLAVTDGMPFFEGDMEIGADRAEIFDVPAGRYVLRIGEMGRDGSEVPTVGVYGSARNPGIVLALEPLGDGDGQPEPIVRLGTCTGKLEGPVAGWRCRAEVQRIENGMAHLRLHVTESTTSGSSRLVLRPGLQLKPGDLVQVRLVRDLGSHWESAWEG